MVKKSKKPTKKSLAIAEEKQKKEIGVKRTKIRVVGIGGGGSSIVSEIAPRVDKASFVVANTDLQALRTNSRKAIRFQFGQNLTHGLGTGMNAEIGELAAQNEKERIKKLLESQDLCIIVACLGGGTGSGATPVFAKISKDLGNLTYGIFTLPFKFEGERKMEIAKNALEKLKPRFNAISVIPNEKIFQIIDKNTSIKGALSAINKNLADSLQGLIEMIYQPGLINIDFADLKTVLQGQGRLAYLNTAEVQGSNRSEEAVKEVLNSPLYPYSIRGAKGVLLNIAGEKNLGLSEISQISKSISELTNKEAKIIFGISQNKKYAGLIKTTLLATGCGPLKIFSKKVKRAKVRKYNTKDNLKKEITTNPKTKKNSPSKKGTKTKPIKRRKKTKPIAKRKNKIKTKKHQRKTSEEKEALPIIPPIEEPKNYSSNQIVQVRRNALQIKKAAEEAEKEMLEKEEIWETPTFLRKKKLSI